MAKAQLEFARIAHLVKSLNESERGRNRVRRHVLDGNEVEGLVSVEENAAARTA